jgi:hypothetical protein
MKHLIKLFAITLLLSLVACSESDQENSDQIAKKETDVISIDGTKHTFTFTEDKQGNITLDKGQEEKEEIITDYFKKNQKASSYYNESDKVLYLFKDSENMMTFMTKNSKQSSLTSKNSNTSQYNTNPVKIELSLYNDANFVNLLNPVDATEDYFYYGINGSSTTRGFEVPNLSQFRQSKNFPNQYRNIEDQISSIKLNVGPDAPIPALPYNFHQVTVVFYEERNFGGYSFGMTLNTFNSETSQSDLSTLRMYKSWTKGSKYYNDRISSYIINAY